MSITPGSACSRASSAAGSGIPSAKNVASGFVDSLVFPTLAFGILAGAPIGSAILWGVTAQMTIAKILGGFLWAFGIVALAKRFGFED